MHELSYVQEVYKIVCNFSEKNKAKKVYTVHISVNKLSGIESKSFQFYWKNITKDTNLKNSVVKISRTATAMICLVCEKMFSSSGGNTDLMRCPHCNSLKITAADDALIKIDSIRIEI